MKSLRLLLAVSSLAFPASAIAQPAGAIECIYKGVPAGDLVLFMAEDDASKAKLKESGAEDRVSDRTKACLSEHHWTEKQTEAALTYAFGRVSADLGEADLGKWGLPPVIVEEMMVDLGPAKVAALVEGKPDAPDAELMGELMLKRMAAHHYSGSQAEAELARIGEAIGRAIAGHELANRAAADFSRPASAPAS